MVTMGLFQLGLEMSRLQVDPAALAPGGGVDLPGWIRLATWALEALALSTLFVLVHGRGWGGASGLLTGWIAWVFRGPLLVVTVAGHAGLPPAPWWSLAFRWWVLYSLCGLLLGVIASLTHLGREPEAPAEILEAVLYEPPAPVYRPVPPPFEEEPVSSIQISERPDDPGATAS
jgi:ABC-type multidrug transport system permease subunit